MADAGYRLTVEGEAEFKRALADINAQVKLNKSEINALTAEYNANGGSLETLQQKQAALGKEMEAQQQKVDLMRQRLEDAKAAYGENSAQVTKLQTDLNNATGALETMRKQYQDTGAQIEDATHSTASYDEAVKQAEAAIAAEKAELDNLTAAYEGTGTKARNLTANEKDLTDQSGALADRQENLAAQQKSLTAQIEAQQKKIDALNGAMKTAADRYGAGSTEAQKYREQIAKAEGELGKMKTSLDKTTKAMEDQSGASGGLLDGLKGLADQFGVQLPGSMDKLLEGFGSLAGPAGAAGLIGMLGELAEKFRELADLATSEAAALVDLSGQTGASTDELQALHYVCSMLNVDTGALDKGLGNLSKKMYEAKPSGEDAEKVFKDIGVAVKDANGEMRSYADVQKDVYAKMLEAQMYGGEAAKGFETAEIALRDANGTFRTADNILEEMYEKYWDAEKGGSEAAKMFRQLGVDVYDANGEMRSTVDVLLDVIDGLKQLTPGAERYAAAEKLMGGSASNLTSLLEMQGDEILEYMRNYVENMGIMNETLVSILDRRDKMLAKEDAAAQNLRRAMGVNWAVGFNPDQSIRDMASNEAGKAFVNWAKTFWERFTHQYARGTSYHPGGLALVGERGPEIVDLPRGSAVYPTGTAPAGTTNNYYDVKIDASRIRELNDIVRIAENERVSRRMGVAR